MNIKFNFKILKIHAKISFQQASVQLMQACNLYQESVKKLNMLILYEKEYRLSLQENMIKYGLEINVWHNYQVFLICLNNLIFDYNKEVNNYKLQLNKAKNYWKKKKIN
ncbi:flagellar FliJ family protein [Wigglesworthia glossinidia]|uniref:flagellar FliJ family protein n=1 Tax=Wigglesworthia glossinidia TaxID=51229 RepID=UPI0002F283A7|nr:flagellar FliJ family protein [Wigglesworthia glossinidia]